MLPGGAVPSWMPVMSKRDSKEPKKPSRDVPSEKRGAHERARSSSILSRPTTNRLKTSRS